jgi:hypothetical protein
VIEGQLVIKPRFDVRCDLTGGRCSAARGRPGQSSG